MVTPIPFPRTSWQQTTGQIQPSGGAKGAVGEITIRADADHFLAEVTKGPGLRLLRVYASGAHPEKVLVRGALLRRGWRGKPADAPAGLQAWAVLPEAFHWAQSRAGGDKTFLFSVADVERGGRTEGGKLVYLDIERGGERIVCRLNR